MDFSLGKSASNFLYIRISMVAGNRPKCRQSAPGLVKTIPSFRGSVGREPRFDQRVAPTWPVYPKPCRFSDSRRLRERASDRRAATISLRKSTYLAQNVLPPGSEN